MTYIWRSPLCWSRSANSVRSRTRSTRKCRVCLKTHQICLKSSRTSCLKPSALTYLPPVPPVPYPSKTDRGTHLQIFNNPRSLLKVSTEGRNAPRRKRPRRKLLLQGCVAKSITIWVHEVEYRSISGDEEAEVHPQIGTSVTIIRSIPGSPVTTNVQYERAPSRIYRPSSIGATIATRSSPPTPATTSLINTRHPTLYGRLYLQQCPTRGAGGACVLRSGKEIPRST